MDYDLFISYASPDLELAQALQRRLTDEGFSVWFDKARLNPGCDWHKEIEAGCEAARVILPILTPRWKQSEWTRYETYGHDLVIPLVFEGEFLVKDPGGDVDEKASISTPPLRHLQNDTIDSQRMDDHEWPRLMAVIRSALATPILGPGKRLTRIRYGHTEHFVGREGKLNEIHEKLWTSPTATLTQGEVQIVTALGGVGKTALAREYADHFWRLYPQIFWIDCRLGIENEFAAVFDLLFPELSNAGLDPNQKARRAFDELNQPAARPMRLLVLDDAPDEQAVLSWIPHAGRCHTVITSRFTAWSNPHEVCKVWVLEPEAARRLLLARAGRDWEALSSDEHAAVDRVAELLGYLPLALEQAAAYIGAPGTGCTYREYIGRSQVNRKHFLSLHQSSGSTEYPWSVYATWRTTIDCLPVGSRAILRMAALMAPTPIPQALWEKSAPIVEAQAQEIGRLPDDRPPLDIQIPEWIAALERYSMVQAHGSVEDRAFSVHGLVQAVEADSITKDAVPKWIEKTRESLIAYAPDETAENPKTWPIWDGLRPHAERLVDLALTNERVEPSLLLMGSLGSLYYGKGLYDLDLRMEEKALEIARRILPPDSADLGHHLISYGECLHQLGRLAEAETAFRESLAINERLKGKDSLEFAEALNYVAIVIGHQGRVQESTILQRQILAIYAEHEQECSKHALVKSLSNLGGILLHSGAIDEAESLLLKSHELAQKHLGTEHPHTLMTLEWTGSLSVKKGEMTLAISRFRQAAAGFAKVLGQHHCEALRSAVCLATVLILAGELTEAESLLGQLLQVSERVLGFEHPYSIMAVSGLGRLLYAKRNYTAAEPLFVRALEASERVLGPEHPDTLARVKDLADLLKAEGDLAGAEPLFGRVLNSKEKNGLTEQPQFAIELNNHALLLRRLKRFDEAASMLRRAIGIDDRFLPRDNPIHAHRRNNLANIYMLADQFDAARHINAEAWSFKVGQHDVTSGRILFTCIALCWLRNVESSHYIGQLRTLLAQPELACLGNILRRWDVADVLDVLRSRLGPEKADLLLAIVSALDEPSKATDLERFDLWQSTTPVLLEVNWPDEPDRTSASQAPG